MGRALAAFVVLGAVLAGGISALSFERGTARACLVVIRQERYLTEWIERSPVIAIGRWEAIDERRVRFVVEEPIKGTRKGAMLNVDNRGTGTAFACSPYEEPFHYGYRFEPGTRSVVLLEKEVNGLWQIAYWSFAVFDVPESANSFLTGTGPQFGRAATDIRLSTILDAAGYEGDISLEAAQAFALVGPNKAPWWPALAVIGSLVGGAGGVG